MAITGRTSTIAQTASATSITGTLPTDRVTGDCVVAIFGMTSTVANFTPPSGWTQFVAPTVVATDRLIAAYYRFDPPSAPAGTTTAAGRQTCICQAYGGVNTSTTADAASVTATGTGGVTVTGITTITDAARLISAVAADTSTATYTVPSGMTLLQQTSGGGGRATGAADETKATAGATGTRTWASTGSGLSHIGFLAALRPASGSPPTGSIKVSGAAGTASWINVGGVATAVTRSSGTPAVVPNGPPGSWTLAFEDLFDGTTLNTSRWVALNGYSVTNVISNPANVSVGSGELKLVLSGDATTGGYVSTAPFEGAGTGYLLMPGHCAQARVYLPGTGGTPQFYNWSGFWTSGAAWPQAGEFDVIETLSGDATANYHYGLDGIDHPSNFTYSTGMWANAFHTYTIHRKATTADWYWDGTLIRTVTTDDTGAGQALRVSIGKSGSRTPVTGDAGAVRVDYVRAWAPA